MIALIFVLLLSLASPVWAGVEEYPCVRDKKTGDFICDDKINFASETDKQIIFNAVAQHEHECLKRMEAAMRAMDEFLPFLYEEPSRYTKKWSPSESTFMKNFDKKVRHLRDQWNAAKRDCWRNK
jgi:hypothetical protein